MVRSNVRGLHPEHVDDILELCHPELRVLHNAAQAQCIRDREAQVLVLKVQQVLAIIIIITTLLSSSGSGSTGGSRHKLRCVTTEA